VKLFDVHTHIQDQRLSQSRDQVIKRSIGAGVDRIMCCGTHENDWQDIVEMSSRYKPIIASYGIHPWFVSHRSSDWLDKLEVLIKHSNAGIGEIGLDHMLPIRNDLEQEAVFMEQLALAKKYGRPVSIHCRKAWGKLVTLLKKAGDLPAGGVIHSWSGSADMVTVIERLGFHISFSGSITRPGNKKAHSACRAVSQDRLLIETDSPDIIPTGIDAPLNEPAFITTVLKQVAAIREESVLNIAQNTYHNAVRLFETTMNSKQL